MSMPDLVSVIMPIYNAAAFMRDAILSVLNQSYTNLELILVDDGSTDDSLSLCNSIAEKDARVLVLHTDNKGPGHARNVGLEHSRGKYICFVDSDDRLHTDALLIMTTKICEDDILQCRSKKVFISGAADNETWPTEEIEIDSIIAMESYLNDATPVVRYSVWAKLYKRSAVGLIRFPEITNSEDVVFNAALITNSNRIKYIPDTLYYVYVREGSLSRSRLSPKIVKDRIICSKRIIEIIEKDFRFAFLVPRANWILAETLIRSYYLSKGFFADSRKEIREIVHFVTSDIDLTGLSVSKVLVFKLFLIMPSLTAWIVGLIMHW